MRTAMRCVKYAVLVTVLIAIAAVAQEKVAAERYPFVFRDVTEEAGAFPHIRGVRAHAGAWGDANGDGWIDYFVGTFWLPETTKSVLLLNEGGKFRPDTQEVLRHVGRTSGAVFVDFDNDGDLDLYISNNNKGTEREFQNTPNFLLENDGTGKFSDVSEQSGACPPKYASRCVVPLDYDGDGLLDFLLGGGPHRGSARPGSRLYRNKGGLKFEDVTAKVGFPEGYGGSSGAVADVNNDGWPDVFFAGSGGGNRLLLNDRKGGFYEAPGTADVFRAAIEAGGQAPTGVCFGDVNRDGLLDLVVGQHTKRPWDRPVAPRLYLNRGIKDGHPAFEDVTEKAGIVPLTLKCPHVEVQDFDNDGWPDIYFSVVKFAGGKTYPVIFKNLGIRDGLARFREDAQAVNDYPTDGDRAIRGGTGPFYDKMVRDRKVTYAVAAPSGDYDRDGRLDLFIAEWWAENPSMLLHNETPSGHWLQVAVEGSKGVNRMGIGSKVKIYEAGRLGEPGALLGCQEIATGYGYSSSQEAVAHFGLGALGECDVEVILPHGKGRIERLRVKANQRITLSP